MTTDHGGDDQQGKAMGGDVTSVCPLGATLGEGPVWVEDVLWCVDIKRRQVHRFDPATANLQSWDAPAQVGWVLPYAPGGLLVGLQTGIHRFDPADGSFALLVDPEPHLTGNRLNDACVDRHGRLWFGTMDDGEQAPSGSIYRADGRGVVRVASGIVITNGPAVSPDGGTLYYTDTVGGIIYAADLDPDGTPGKARVFVRIPAAEGHPDGPSVDADGHVWTGVYGGWQVRRYAPDGRLDRSVAFPVKNITKVALGGPGLATAYATTARHLLTDEECATAPSAGDLFAFAAGVAGVPCRAVEPIGTTLLSAPTSA